MTFLVQLFRRVRAVSAGIAIAGTTLAAHAAELTPAPDLRAPAGAATCQPAPAVTAVTALTAAAVTALAAGTPVLAGLPAACPPEAGAAPAADDETFPLKATLYVTNARSSGRDSIGCQVVPLRTVAVDGHVVPRHTILFIKETVGLRMPDGSVHDGYWYATDTGSAIHAGRIDLYTGKGVATIAPLLHLNLKDLTVRRAGTFTGCPDPDGRSPVAAQAGSIAASSRATSTVAKDV